MNSLGSISASLWDWKSLFHPETFVWEVGRTPLTSLSTILFAWLIYFSVILGLKEWMKHRPAYKLSQVTAFHNLVLCTWSLAMFLSTVYYVYERGLRLGVDEVFCTVDKANFKGPLAYTMYIYYLSKFYELFDTVILVLKKVLPFTGCRNPFSLE
jgi:fatty acid elongase 3